MVKEKSGVISSDDLAPKAVHEHGTAVRTRVLDEVVHGIKVVGQWCVVNIFHAHNKLRETDEEEEEEEKKRAEKEKGN